jgi:hypothetical protein
MDNLLTRFDNRFSGNSSDARWGFAGAVISFLLFVPPLAIYFFVEGDVLMISSTIWVILGILVSIVWVGVLVFGLIIMIRWCRRPLTDDTGTRLLNIETNLANLTQQIGNLTNLKTITKSTPK